MIPTNYILDWRRAVPWTGSQVEQDLVLCRALVALYQHPLLAEQLAFRGGTAMHKLVFSPPARYSEDLDFVQRDAGPIGPMMNAVRTQLDPWLGKPKYAQTDGRATFIYRFMSEMPPVAPLRLKVEINTREHTSEQGLVRRPFAVESPWFAGTADILTYSADELFASKVRALYQRKKGRDLFDLWLALSQRLIDARIVIACFQRLLAGDGLKVSKADVIANLVAKLIMPAFRCDIEPLISPDIEYRVEDAYQVVRTELLELLP